MWKNVRLWTVLVNFIQKKKQNKILHKEIEAGKDNQISKENRFISADFIFFFFFYSIAPCAKVVPPPHGIISEGGFKHGASVMFYCRYGYTRAGASSITCNNGNWNKPTPVCKG